MELFLAQMSMLYMSSWKNLILMALHANDLSYVNNPDDELKNIKKVINCELRY